MNNEKQMQAKNLYFQTELNKTQIADLLKISRRSLHYWIRENNWDRLKRAATHLPAMLAENCYMLINQFTNTLLAENRIMRPITSQEAETLHKLTLSVKKLKNHSTLNESMEMFAHFMERINKKSPALADQIMPFVDEYVEEWAKLSIDHFKPDHLNDQGFIPVPASDSPEYLQETTEIQKDNDDFFAWEKEAGLVQEMDLHDIASHYKDIDDRVRKTEYHRPEKRKPSNAIDNDSTDEQGITDEPDTTDDVMESSSNNASDDVMVSPSNPAPRTSDSALDKVIVSPSNHGLDTSLSPELLKYGYPADLKKRVLSGDLTHFEARMELSDNEIARRRSLLDFGDNLAEKFPDRPAV